MKRVLIVEDEAMLREVYATLLTLQNFEVYQAGNGKEAIELLQSVTPDLIILDALMPIMGGIAFLEAVKPRENYPDTRILFLSNLSDRKTIARGEKLGAHKYLLKADVAPTQLLHAVNDLLRMS